MTATTNDLSAITDLPVLSTKELLEKVIEKATNPESNCVEASLLLAGGCRATHYLVYDPGTKVLYDTGIDDEEYETTLEEFANDPLYGKPNARWLLWDN